MSKRSSEDVESTNSNSSGAAVSSGGEETVCGVKLEHVNRTLLAKFAKEHKVAVKKDATTEDLVTAVSSFFTSSPAMKGVEMLVCDRCDGASPESLSACPFCGELSEDPASSVIGGTSEADPPSEIEREAGRATRALAKVGPSMLASNAAPPAPRKLAPATDDALEEAVGKIQSLKRDCAQNAWLLGQQLLVVSEETKERPALWRLRKKADGVTPAYDSFKAFLRAEVGFSFRMAASCMYMTKNFSAEKLQLVSTSKMEIVLNAPEAERKKLLSAAATLPQRQLKQKVRDLNIAHGLHEKRRGARQERAKKENAAKDDKSGVVTFTLPGKKGKAWLFRKEKDSKGKLIPAHSLADNYGWIEGTNGVRLVFSVTKEPNGQLRVSYEAKR